MPAPIWLPLGVMLLLAACTPSDPATETVQSPPAVARVWRQDTAYSSFVLYHHRQPAASVGDHLQSVVAESVPDLRVVEVLPDAAHELLVAAWQVDNLAEDYPPPDADYLKHYGKGISAQQAQDVAASLSAWRVVYAYPSRQAVQSLAAVDRSVFELARRSDALIWDSETRLLYAPDSFHEERVAFAEASSNVMRQTVIHAYQDGEYVRQVSLGMAKFGLPDLVIGRASWATWRSLGWLMVGISQQMVEGVEGDASGAFAFDASAIRNASVREKVTADPIAGASLAGTFGLSEVMPEEGDADNTLLAIGFDSYAGNDEFARQDTAMATVFGWRDAIKRIEHNEELRAASEAAREKLPQLRRDFEAGLAPGEYIQVKAPFPTSSGSSEWMWVEVTAWRDDAIDGLLRNEPFDIPELHAGQKVEIDPDNVFDYLRYYADGREEGNSTGEVIARMQGETESAGSE